MPLYDFDCTGGHRFERQVKLENFSDPQHCACGAPATRVISAPRIKVDSVNYRCPVTGKHIGSEREHRENLARQGCRVLETGEKEANARDHAAAEAAFDKNVEATVEKQFEALPSAKKEKLANELTAGADVSVIRR